jgi:pyridoxine 5'-phosphate synthase PdxJ
MENKEFLDKLIELTGMNIDRVDQQRKKRGMYWRQFYQVYYNRTEKGVDVIRFKMFTDEPAYSERDLNRIAKGLTEE